MNLEEIFQKGSFKLLLRTGFSNGTVRRMTLPFAEKKIWQAMVENNPIDFPFQVRRDKYDISVAMMHSVARGLDKGVISKNALNRLIETLLGNVILSERRQRAIDRLGFEPPLFILVSPGKKCNLHCTGCYACSDSHSAAKLDWDTFDRIIAEKERLWGSHFTVISGGEPFMWQDNDRDILDMALRHPSQFFLVYTNSTLITKSVAKEMAKLGNVTPAISVEGFEQQTDKRRGKGVHKRILQAMENLREVGVPFGISVTATRENADIVTSDEFNDFYFDEQCATYGWIFQYMPIGRRHTLDMMVTPQQRLEMYNRTWRTVREQKIFIADFWNSGTASSGCISAGRPGGYFYITWDGDITPCAFVPYSIGNIYDIFQRGDNLDTILHLPFFERIRQWQNEYGYAQPAENVKNWLCPCVIRDHFDVLFNAVRDTNAKPIDEEAVDALADPEYHSGMIAYGNDYDNLSSKVWDEHYMARQTVNS
ncbi:MAG: radical SAM protein [Planctomycetota bacterium]|nr:MAG: radical SAM protein [Planctomycetota bacterium]